MIFEMGILSTRKVGILLALFWIGTLCYIYLPDTVPDFLHLRSTTTSAPISELSGGGEASKKLLVSSKEGGNIDEIIHVCITSDKNTLGGAVALMNSIVSNTKSKVKFHLVVDEESADHVSVWLMTSKLKNMSFEVKTFPSHWVDGKIKLRGGRTELGSPLNYARYYLPNLFPQLREKIIFIDDDCIVQGDIKELYHTPIKEGHWAAFSEDCVGMNKRLSGLINVYAEFLDFKNPHVQRMGLKPTTCSFNTGLFVTDLSLWVKNNITEQLEYWMDLNTKEEVYGNERGGGGSQPPMMIVFYNKISPIDPMWHVRYLGWTAGTSYSKTFIAQAKLLHWNGKFKPWGRVAQHSNVWDKYYIPDPGNRFKPIRRN